MKYNIHWMRRDLRTNDNAALHHALQSGLPVKCIFIFDENILENLTKKDARVVFIHDRLEEIKSKLNESGGDLIVFHGKPVELWNELAKDKNLKGVFANRDYEPYAQNRDKEVYEILKENNIDFKGFKDHLIFEKQDILTQNNDSYKVYTPYSKSWKQRLTEDDLKEYSIHFSKSNVFQQKKENMISLEKLGFEEIEIPDLPLDLRGIDVKDYDKVRDFPATEATTKLGTALRFGTLSVRRAVKFAQKYNQTFLNELIWREFFAQILYNFPQVEKEAFRKQYDNIKWRNNEKEFDLWCQGKTGFPIVDAGMRELNETGFMHNRVRMIVASFLVKDLLIDWRWGEAYFAEKLMDFELASNNGNWQWAAGCGTDAAPYFRIFNPTSQQKKFDPDLEYIKKWIPEFGTDDYPDEIVNHKEARERCLQVFKEAIN